MPRIVKNLSQFSLLVKSPRVCRRSVADDDDDDWFFFFFPIFGLQLVTSLSPLGFGVSINFGERRIFFKFIF